MYVTDVRQSEELAQRVKVLGGRWMEHFPIAEKATLPFLPRSLPQKAGIITKVADRAADRETQEGIIRGTKAAMGIRIAPALVVVRETQEETVKEIQVGTAKETRVETSWAEGKGEVRRITMALVRERGEAERIIGETEVGTTTGAPKAVAMMVADEDLFRDADSGSMPPL